MTQLLAELEGRLSDGALVTDPDLTAAYRSDESLMTDVGAPLAVVRARDVNDVAATIQLAAAARTPVVVRGAGTGLSGGANALDGCIILSTERMNRIVEIDPARRLAVVEPGVLNGDLSTAVEVHGLFYPPDPASADISTIGGNVGTNAGGLCCIKYGVTGNYVLGLKVVLGTGEIIRTGRQTVKGVAGLDLVSLFVGSGGTLGVVTEITLRLLARPAHPATMVASFDTLEAAGHAVSKMTASHTRPSMLEILDRNTLNAINEWKSVGLDTSAAALIIAQSDEPSPRAELDVEHLSRISTDAGASYVAHSTDRFEADELVAIRKLAYPALERRGTALLDDIAVPVAAIASMLIEIERIGQEQGLFIATFGHAGDGNLHPTIVYDGGDPETVRRAHQAFRDIIHAALALGGTITGEHGVGSLKRRFLRAERATRIDDLESGIKAVFDPAGILNPGKWIRPAPPSDQHPLRRHDRPNA